MARFGVALRRTMEPITAIAARLGLTADLLEPYGNATAKIRLETLERFRSAAAS